MTTINIHALNVKFAQENSIVFLKASEQGSFINMPSLNNHLKIEADTLQPLKAEETHFANLNEHAWQKGRKRIKWVLIISLICVICVVTACCTTLFFALRRGDTPVISLYLAILNFIYAYLINRE